MPGEITSVNDEEGWCTDPPVPWYPGVGKCFICGEWHQVPGYTHNGFAETWPVIVLYDTAEPATYDYPGSPPVEVAFNELSREERLHYWPDLIEQHG